MKQLLLAFCLMICYDVSFAQLNVKTNGSIFLGTMNDTRMNGDDRYRELTLHILGSGGELATLGRVAIGDYGSADRFGNNVYWGEYRGSTSFDTDIFQLHGKNGFRFTAGRAGNSEKTIVNYSPGSHNFDLYANLYVNGSRVTSDSRLKREINAVEDDHVELLMELEPVSYRYVGRPVGSISIDSSRLDDPKYLADMEAQQGQIASIDNKPKEYGLIAQQVQEILPDLVSETTDGYLAVHYDGIIPLLIAALKQQAVTIEQIEAQLEALQQIPAQKTMDDARNGSTPLFGLQQNIPNPFDGTTTIRFAKQNTQSEAIILITNLQGQTIDKIGVADGKNAVTFNSDGLASGIYNYALVENGQVIDIKQMVIK